jgi:hypothetical protein
LDFSAVGGKRQGRELPQSLRVEPGRGNRFENTQSWAPKRKVTVQTEDDNKQERKKNEL